MLCIKYYIFEYMYLINFNIQHNMIILYTVHIYIHICSHYIYIFINTYGAHNVMVFQDTTTQNKGV